MRKIKKIQRKFTRKIISKEYLYYLMIIGAVTLSITAAFFSVYGLSCLFSRARVPVIIMGSTLEICKLITVSVYYRLKEILPKLIKRYLFVAILFLMGITSLGIYSYLTNAYQFISNELDRTEKDSNIVSIQITNIEENLKSKKLYLDNLNNRYKALTDINITQQNRLQSAVEITNYTTIAKTRKEIENTNEEIKSISDNISKITDEIDSLLKKKNDLNEKLKVNNNKTASSDIGPLKFLSKLFHIGIDMIVSILIFIIIIIFDPLAIVLVLIANIVFIEKKNSTGIKRKYKKRRRKRRKKSDSNDIIE